MSRDKPLRRDFFFGNPERGEHRVLLRWDQADGLPEFTPGKANTHWVDFEIFEVVGWNAKTKGVPEPDGGRCYGEKFKPWSDELEPEITGFVKWDGCTQIYFPDAATGPAIHVDAADQLALLFETITEVRRIALVDVMAEGVD